MRSILAIDQGTTNTKVLRVGESGEVLAFASHPVRTRFPANGWAEQDSQEILTSVAEAVAEVLQTGPAPDAVAVSNQRETVVVWDRVSGRPLSPAITWQCRRAESVCQRLRSEHLESKLRQLTGLMIDPLFSAGKLAWVLDHDPVLQQRARDGEVCCGTIDSWLIWNLTGGKRHVSDFGNASRTQLLNISSCGWDDELLDIFGVPRAILPQLVPSAGVLGEAESMGLRGIPIASAVGDSHAALAGHGVLAPGAVKATYGTGTSLLSLTPSLPAALRLASTIAWYRNGHPSYALEGNITMSGAAVQWLGEFLQLPDPVDSVLKLAGSVADSCGITFVPAMAGLGAPHWDSAARGTIHGLATSGTLAQLARAAVEAIAFQVRDVFEAMCESHADAEVLFADGGATRNDWLMQFQADLLGRPVMRSACPHLSALGAAFLAGLATGVWSSCEEIRSLLPAPDRFDPALAADERERRISAWQSAVARTRSRCA